MKFLLSILIFGPTKSLIRTLSAKPFQMVYDDYPDAFIPELWANESIMILEENMVIGNLVHRDFENMIQSYGDTVNTRKPGEFKAKRKSRTDNVTIQANTAQNVAVLLNQQLHTSFLINDADQSKSFKDLVAEYLYPAMLSIARGIDLITGSQVFQFLGNSGGQLGKISGTNAEDYMLDTREVLNINKAHEMNRNLVLTTKSETALLKDDKFTSANRVGDDGTALRTASIGMKYGLQTFMAQNQPYVAPLSSSSVVTGAVNMAGGAVEGATSITVDNFATAIAVGTWLTIDGEDVPHRVVSTTGGGTPTAIVLDRGLRRAIADNAVVTLIAPGAINYAGGYPAGYDKEITVDTFPVMPKVGQLVSFGASASSAVYGIIDVDSGAGTITLDRPLEASIADNDPANAGPAGSYNFAFHRNALSLVCRPLALPIPGTGARAGRANFNGLSMRVVMTYDGNAQGHLVTVDCLLGVKVLDSLLGAVMYG